MVTIEVWRARIGSHHCGTCGFGSLAFLRPSLLPTLQVVILHFLIILILLVIGNVELNPGPNGYRCNYGGCNVILSTLGQHAYHQKLHSNDSNFYYACGLPGCLLNFSTFASLNSHISKCHKFTRNFHVDDQATQSINCQYCQSVLPSIHDLCKHLLKDHIGKPGMNVICPLQEVCERTEPFATASAFSSHLSKYHANWRDIPRTSAQVSHPVEGQYYDYPENFIFVGSDLPQGSEDEDTFFDAEDTIAFTEEDIFDCIISFYMMLEVKCMLPVTTIDKIAKNLSFLTEMVHQSMRHSLIHELKLLDIPDDKIHHVSCKMVGSDPLYLCHHKNTRGPDVISNHLRKKHIQQRHPELPIEFPNFLSRDPIDGERYAYLPLKCSLSLLFEDKSVQKELVESFQRNTEDNGSVLRDYTDGSVCKGRNLPPRRIDLLIFQDAFSATSMLTTVQQKHKVLGMYMTLGNLKSWNRTKLKAMHLVMLVLEKHVKKYRQKCFARLKNDLKELEETGIEFMNETIPVHVQFFIGDNLGNHFLGGFVESFTASHFCRYCDIPKAELKNNAVAVRPFRTHSTYKCSALKAKLKRLKHHHGVKEDSVFNDLSSFKVCDPGLSPCLGHDIYHGVADWDLKSMISYFVKKEWFTYDLLNNRISQFHYSASDSKNKPAPVKNVTGKTGKKKTNLGGSAVQNSVLVRLLPFIIEGCIKDKNDAVWKLYIKLKTICEFICAPALTSEQVDELDVLIQSYLLERSMLSNKSKPKHHFLRHYPDLIRKMGPLMHLWAMRFEHMHQFFKKTARAANSYKNLIVTSANKYLLLFLYQLKESRFKELVTDCKPFSVEPGVFKRDVYSLIQTCLSRNNLKGTEKIKINGIKYNVGNLLILEKTSTALQVGWIEAILLDGSSIHFILKKQEATFNSDLGIYQILSLECTLIHVAHSCLQNPCIQPVYNFDDFPSFSLKHTFPETT